MTTRRFVYPVLADTFIRREQVIAQGKVIRFVVQLEIESSRQSKAQPVIRYDTAHGFIHIDRYNMKGEQRKERLAIMDFNQALTLAEQDIVRNWPMYREKFLQGEFP